MSYLKKLVKRPKFLLGGPAEIYVIPVDIYPEVASSPNITTNQGKYGINVGYGVKFSKEDIDDIYRRYANDPDKWNKIAREFGFSGMDEILKLLQNYNKKLRQMGGDPIKANSNYVLEDGKLGKQTFDMLFGHRNFDMPPTPTIEGGIVLSYGTPNNLLSPEGLNRLTSANYPTAKHLKSKYYGSVGRSDVGQSAGRAGINGWDDPDLSNWWANTGFKLDPADRNLGTDDLIRKYMSSYLKALKNKSSKAYKLFVNKDNQWNMRTAKHDKTFMRNFSKWRLNQGL